MKNYIPISMLLCSRPLPFDYSLFRVLPKVKRYGSLCCYWARHLDLKNMRHQNSKYKQEILNGPSMSVITLTSSSSTSKYLRWNLATHVGACEAFKTGETGRAVRTSSTVSQSGERIGVGTFELYGRRTSLLPPVQLKFHSQSSLESFDSEITTDGCCCWRCCSWARRLRKALKGTFSVFSSLNSYVLSARRRFRKADIVSRGVSEASSIKSYSDSASCWPILPIGTGLSAHFLWLVDEALAGEVMGVIEDERTFEQGHDRSESSSQSWLPLFWRSSKAVELNK